MINSDKRITANGNAQAVVFMGGRIYDAAQFLIPADAVDLSLKFATPVDGHAFNKVARAYFSEISFDGDISIKMNTVDDDPIHLYAQDSPWKNEHIEMEDVFVTNNSGDEVILNLLLL